MNNAELSGLLSRKVRRAIKSIIAHLSTDISWGLRQTDVSANLVVDERRPTLPPDVAALMEDSVELLQEIRELGMDLPWDLLFDWGLYRFCREEFEQAVAVWQESAALEPYALTHSNMGAAYYVLRSLDAAEAACRTALELDANCTAAHLNLAHVLIAKGLYMPAIEACTEFALRMPSDPRAHNLLGFGYLGAGLYDLSVEAHRTAAEVDPRNPVAQLGVAQTQLIAGQFFEALDHLLKTTDLFTQPQDRCVYQFLGLAALIMQGRPQDSATYVYSLLPHLSRTVPNYLPTWDFRPILAAAKPHLEGADRELLDSLVALLRHEVAFEEFRATFEQSFKPPESLVASAED